MKLVRLLIVLVAAGGGVEQVRGSDMWFQYEQEHFIRTTPGQLIGGQMVEQITLGQPLLLNTNHEMNVYHQGGGSASGVTISIPDSFNGAPEADRLTDFTRAGGRYNYRMVEPLQVGQSHYTEMRDTEPTQVVASPIGITRTWDTPLLTSDSMTGRYTFEIQTTAGALAGKNQFDIEMAPSWQLEPGITASVVPGSWSMPSEFFASDNYVWFSGTSPAQLSGTYTIQCDIQVTRSGPYAQATYGDMYFTPGAYLRISDQDYVRDRTAQSITLPGTDMRASVQAPADVTWSGRVYLDSFQIEHQPMVIPSSYAVEVEELDLIKFKSQKVTGTDQYKFMCDVGGQNIVRATVQTPDGPNQATYNLGVEWEDDQTWAGLEVLANSDADLVNMGFINGRYELTLYDVQGNTTDYILRLTGDYPTTTPNITTDSFDDPDNITLQWQAPPASTDLIHIALSESGDIDTEYLSDSLISEHNYGAIPNVGYQAAVAFFEGEVDFTGDIVQIIGYVNESYKMILPYVDVLGDFNSDNRVEASDLALLLDNWGQTIQPTDWTKAWDGFVDANELANLLDNWGVGLSGPVELPDLAAIQPVVVPEPISLVCLMMGLSVMARRPNQ